jgi:hypothetical protein
MGKSRFAKSVPGEEGVWRVVAVPVQRHTDAQVVDLAVGITLAVAAPAGSRLKRFSRVSWARC